MRLLQVVFGFTIFSWSLALRDHIFTGELFHITGDERIGKYNILVNADLANVTLFDDGRYDLTVPGYDRQTFRETHIAPENRTLYQFITRGFYSGNPDIDALFFRSAQTLPWEYPERLTTHLCTVAYQKFTKVDGWKGDEITVQQLVDELVRLFKSRNNTLESVSDQRDIVSIDDRVYFAIIDGDRFVDNNIDYLSGLTHYGYFMDVGVPKKASCMKIWTLGNTNGWKVGFGADRSAVEAINCDNQDYSYFEITTPKKSSPPWMKVALRRIISLLGKVVNILGKLSKVLWKARSI